MKRNSNNIRKSAAIIMLSTAIILTACGTSGASATQPNLSLGNEGENFQNDQSKQIVSQSGITVADEVYETENSAEVIKLIEEKRIYNRDYEYTDWKNGKYTTIKLNGSSGEVSGEGAIIKNGILTISKGGTYVLSGVFNGKVYIDAKDQDVRIVLNKVNISSQNSAAIEAYDSNRVTVSLEEGTINTVSDKKVGEILDKDSDEVTATIFGKDDLVINGSGKLVVQGNNNDAIGTRGNLIVMSGDIKIKSEDDGIVGKDSVQIENGTLDIDAQGDGIKSSNDTDEGKGYVLIDGGKISVSSGDDGLKGEQMLIATGGEIDVKKSVEGIEAMDLIFSGGTINIKSSDDAINAAGKTSGNTLAIYGGDITVDAQGDGIDVNGSAKMTGGILTVNGPTNGGNAALDTDEGFDVVGGTLVMSGSAGMLQLPSQNSSQETISLNFETIVNAGSTVTIKDSGGNVVAEATPTKKFQNIIFSNSKIKSGEKYTVLVDNKETVKFETVGIITSVGKNGTVSSTGGLDGAKKGFAGQGQDPPEPPGGFKGNYQPEFPTNQNLEQ